MLDRQLVSDLETFAVDPKIVQKLDEHEVLDDLDVLKLIQQLYTVGWTWTIVPDGRDWDADNFNREEF